MYLELLPLLTNPKSSQPDQWAFELKNLHSEQRIWILQQAKARNSIRQKLPSWLTPEMVFPPSTNLQQSSSEITALDKLDLLSGNNILDLTGGFGVDSIIFAKAGYFVTHVEPNAELQTIAKHNSNYLLSEPKNLAWVNQTAEHYIQENLNLVFDTIYIDPSRRDENQNKVILLEDYKPNLLELLPRLLQIAPNVVAKISPMTDLNYLISRIPELKKIRIISVKNECKELVLVIQNQCDTRLMIETKNFLTDDQVQTFSFFFEEMQPISPIDENLDHLEKATFLYDVNSSIHKAQAYSIIEQTFQIAKVAPQTHIFYGDTLIPNFPGKQFRIKNIHPYKKTSPLSSGYNIVPRNFPDSEPQIRQKLKLKKNGIPYLYAVRNRDQKPILIECEPIETVLS